MPSGRAQTDVTGSKATLSVPFPASGYLDLPSNHTKHLAGLEIWVCRFFLSLLWDRGPVLVKCKY